MTHAAKRLTLAALGAVALLATLPRHAPAAIGISPAYIEVDLEKGRPAGQFIISNMGDVEERYRITAVHFNFMPEGGLREVPPDEHSMANWIRFSPTEFVLAPKTRRVIRFVIVPRGRLVPGEYWAGMQLESLNTSVGTGKDEQGREFKLEVVPSILVPLFGTVGEVAHTGAVKDVKILGHADGKPTIEALVTNTGTGRILLTSTFDIRDASGKPVASGPLGRSFILRGSNRLYVAPLTADLPEGSYTVKVTGNSPDLAQPVEAEVQLNWKPPPPPTKPPATTDQPAESSADRPADDAEGARKPVPSATPSSPTGSRTTPTPGTSYARV